jgi:hypothetical protein
VKIVKEIFGSLIKSFYLYIVIKDYKMIKEKNRHSIEIEIDLTGSQGNAYALIRLAIDLSKRLNEIYGEQKYDTKKITDDMTSGDYDHLIEVLETNFGEHIIIYR